MDTMIRPCAACIAWHRQDTADALEKDLARDIPIIIARALS